LTSFGTKVEDVSRGKSSVWLWRSYRRDFRSDHKKQRLQIDLHHT